MNDTPNHVLTPWTQSWFDYQKMTLGESACKQLGFYVIPEQTLVSVVIPICNEQSTLKSIVQTVSDVPINKEIVLVDDGSTDRSPELARSLQHALSRTEPGSVNRIIIETHTSNRGKGAALKTGFALASGDIVVVQDADLEYDPNEIPRLIQPIIENEADVVFGSRFLGDAQQSGHRAGYFWNYIGNRCLTTLSNMFTNLNLTDIETGHKAFTREVLDLIGPHLRSDGFAIEPELTARVAQEKFRVFEVPVSYTGRSYAEGKKIRWYDGIEAIYSIIRFGLFG